MRPDGGCVGYYTMVLVVNALLGLGRWWCNRSTSIRCTAADILVQWAL